MGVIGEALVGAMQSIHGTSTRDGYLLGGVAREVSTAGRIGDRVSGFVKTVPRVSGASHIGGVGYGFAGDFVALLCMCSYLVPIGSEGGHCRRLRRFLRKEIMQRGRCFEAGAGVMNICGFRRGIVGGLLAGAWASSVVSCAVRGRGLL